MLMDRALQLFSGIEKLVQKEEVGVLSLVEILDRKWARVNDLYSMAEIRWRQKSRAKDVKGIRTLATSIEGLM